MSENCDVIDIFRIFGQFRAVRRPDSRHKVCKSYFSINSNLLSWKKRKTKQTKHSSHTIALSEGTFLDNFLQNNADISKVKAAQVLKGIFSETTYRCVLTCQIRSFQHNSNEFFREEEGWEGNFSTHPPPPPPPPPPSSKRTPKERTQIRVKKIQLIKAKKNISRSIGLMEVWLWQCCLSKCSKISNQKIAKIYTQKL